ncbi:hypothetical protein TNCV_4430671 [Trichonephila clavipes]|nr:hypothetical protein TNCV_4430671 [Trichonephila clavipes]
MSSTPVPLKIRRSWLEIYANLQSPKTPKNISDKVPYRFVTRSINISFLIMASVSSLPPTSLGGQEKGTNSSRTERIWQPEEKHRLNRARRNKRAGTKKPESGDVVGLSLAFSVPKVVGSTTAPKSVDFPDVYNRQWPCGMIIRHEKDPLSVHLSWMLSAKLNS